MPSNVLTPPTGSGHGLLAEYFDNPDLAGAPKLSRVEPRIFQQQERDRPGGGGSDFGA